MTTKTSRRSRTLAVGGSLLVTLSLGIGSAAQGRVAVLSADRSQHDDIEEVRVQVRGTGRVISIPRGIECNDECDRKFAHGTEVVLVAGSRPESRFVRWDGDCVGRSSLCVLVADRTARVTASFERDPDPEIGFVPHAQYFLYVTGPRAGVGGSIKSERPAVGINCPGVCAKKFLRNTPVTVKAHAMKGFAPLWESYPPGICSGDRCDVVLRADVHVSATFKRARP